jgi:hypothetical protein
MESISNSAIYRNLLSAAAALARADFGQSLEMWANAASA